MTSFIATRRAPDDGRPSARRTGRRSFAFYDHCFGLWLEGGAIERGDDARAEIPEPVHGGDRRLDDAGVGRAFGFV
jgi:hypothetical protein